MFLSVMFVLGMCGAWLARGMEILDYGCRVLAGVVVSAFDFGCSVVL